MADLLGADLVPRGRRGHVGKGLSSRTLFVSPGGRWTFGSSSGTWSVRPIRASDCRRWGASPPAPGARSCSRAGTGRWLTAPIEESRRVGVLWVVYWVAPPPVRDPGTVWLTFSRIRR